MIDVRKPATLQGFHVSVADIGDQMHLCHPLLSFENDDALYLAHKLDWQNDPGALAITDPNEAAVHGTLLPPTCSQPIAFGEGVIAMGVNFVHAADSADVDLVDSEPRFRSIDDLECWMAVATPALYGALRTRIAAQAQAAFDEALGGAVCFRDHLSERGTAALLLMRRCASGRRDDLAIRQLAGARQNGEFDLYRRLLIRFALELDAPESALDERVGRHIAAAGHLNHIKAIGAAVVAVSEAMAIMEDVLGTIPNTDFPRLAAEVRNAKRMYEAINQVHPLENSC